jgi:hydrocephalus-inducing protein
LTHFQGLDYIDVPAGGSKEYKLQFFAYKEGLTMADIVFRNEQTLEFVAYETTFRASATTTMDTVHLTSVVRQAVAHTISLDNPLGSPVTFSVSCVVADRSSCPEIHAPASFRAPAKSENAEFTFEFLPVRAREFSAKLVLSSSELGAFQYDLVLCGTPAPPLPIERFKASLGEAVTRRFRFVNYSSQRGEYTITMDADEFTAPATIATAAAVKTGSEVTFDISFEPSRLGDTRCTMTIASLQGGEFVCPLFGQCMPPRPSGPHTIRSGDRIRLPFKNVFASTETFAYTCDNTLFSVKASETFRGKETKDIVVKYDGLRDDMARPGKLSVVCTGGAAVGTEWVFYLKGVPA